MPPPDEYGLLSRNITANKQELDPRALASNRYADITKGDSELRQGANLRGKNIANSRGLLDSTFFGQAAEREFIDRATPLATADASAYGNRQDRNQDSENAFRLKDKDYYNKLGAQEHQQKFTSKENLLDRRFTAGENELTRAHEFGLQTSEQEWLSGENDLDRVLKKYLQSSDQAWQSSEKTKDRGHDVTLLDKQLTFTGSENQKDRDFTGTENQKDRVFTGTESQKDRDLTTSESEKDRVFTSSENVAQRSWQTVENTLDRKLTASESGLQRTHEKVMQGEALTHDEEQAFLDRIHDVAMQDDQQSWATGENEEDRILQKFMLGEQLTSDEKLTLIRTSSAELIADKNIEANYKLQADDLIFRGDQAVLDRMLTTSENDLDRKLQEKLQLDDQSWRTGENEDDRELQERLFLADQVFQGDENALDRLLQEKLQSDDQTWRTGENELDRLLTSHLDAYNRKWQGNQNALDRELTKNIQEGDQDFQTKFQYAQNLYEQGEADKQRDFVAGEGDKDRAFTAEQGELDRESSVDAQVREFEQRNVEQVTDHVNRLREMGYAFELDSDLQSTGFAASTMSNMLAGVNSIMADPELTPEAKKGAIANLQDVVNSQLSWAATFYSTDMPAVQTPTGDAGGSTGILNPNPDYDSGGAPDAPGVETPATPGIDAATSDRYETMVGGAFRGVLGRDPEPEGLAYWSNMAAQQGWSQAQLEAAIKDSAMQNGEL
jgi:hypothetical protein